MMVQARRAPTLTQATLSTALSTARRRVARAARHSSSCPPSARPTQQRPLGAATVPPLASSVRIPTAQEAATTRRGRIEHSSLRGNVQPSRARVPPPRPRALPQLSRRAMEAAGATRQRVEMASIDLPLLTMRMRTMRKWRQRRRRRLQRRLASPRSARSSRPRLTRAASRWPIASGRARRAGRSRISSAVGEVGDRGTRERRDATPSAPTNAQWRCPT